MDSICFQRRRLHNYQAEPRHYRPRSVPVQDIRSRAERWRCIIPVSDLGSIVPILTEVLLTNPEGTMDIGVGFGKYGVLCREVLEAVHGRCAPDTWEKRIVGIEGFEAYRNPAWDVYDEVQVADFTKVYESIVGWPLVLMIDSLEHVDKVTGEIILEYLVRNNGRVIVSTPVGECPQEGVFGNEFERHRTTFTTSSFNKYAHRVLHSGVCHVVSIKGNG